MTDLQLYSEISSLPSDLKQEVSDFVDFLKHKSKKDRINQTPKSTNILEEPTVKYNSKFSDLLLNGPVFSEEQIKEISETRKSINEWRTKP